MREGREGGRGKEGSRLYRRGDSDSSRRGASPLPSNKPLQPLRFEYRKEGMDTRHKLIHERKEPNACNTPSPLPSLPPSLFPALFPPFATPPPLPPSSSRRPPPPAPSRPPPPRRVGLLDSGEDRGIHHAVSALPSHQPPPEPTFPLPPPPRLPPSPSSAARTQPSILFTSPLISSIALSAPSSTPFMSCSRDEKHLAYQLR